MVRLGSLILVGCLCGAGWLPAQEMGHGARPAEGQTTAIEHVGKNGVVAPVVIYQREPEFSEEARKDKIGGAVLIYLQVGVDGLPMHVRILRGVGYGLDEKAVEAVKAYKFKPAMKDGAPVTVEMNVQVNFEVRKRHWPFS